MTRLGSPVATRNLLHEIEHEIGDVLAPFGERRHPHRHHREPVIEVLAEFAGRDIGFDVARGRGHDPHVDGDLVRAADPLEGLVDQHPQDLVLGLARHVGDFVDEQRAAVRLFERADLALLRRRSDASMPNSSVSIRSGVIAAALMTRNGACARDDWACKRAGGQLLAGAGRADDQHAAVGRRHLFDREAQLVDRGRMSDQRGRQRRELLERPHLPLEPRVLQGALSHQHQPVGLERLFDEVVGALLDRRHRGLDVAVAGDHHHRQIRMLLLDRVEQLQPVEAAALQPDVEEHQARAPRRDRRQRVVRNRAPCASGSPRPAGCRRPAPGCRFRRQR